MLKVLIISQYFWPENFRINDLAVGLREKGHEVVVLTGIPNYPKGEFFSGYGYTKRRQEVYNGVQVIRSILTPRGTNNPVLLALNYLVFCITASLKVFFMKRDDFDFIFVAQYSPVTVGLPGIVAKKHTGKPLFFWIQDLWPESLSATGAVKSQTVLRWVDKLVRYIYSQCDFILVQSKGFISEVVSKGFDAQKIGYLPNWAESLYQPVTAQDALDKKSLMPDGFRIMFAGNIGAAQDFETILSAAELLKDRLEIQWVILGDGRMRSWVEEEISCRGLDRQVHMLGQYPMEDMPKFFSLADVMLVTLKDEPIFALTVPGKIQSYLACAKPIVAALNGEGARVIREAKAGFAGPAEDAKELAKNIVSMYEMDQEARASMGANARKYYEGNFERDMLISKLETWQKSFSK